MKILFAMWVSRSARGFNEGGKFVSSALPSALRFRPPPSARPLTDWRWRQRVVTSQTYKYTVQEYSTKYDNAQYDRVGYYTTVWLWKQLLLLLLTTLKIITYKILNSNKDIQAFKFWRGRFFHPYRIRSWSSLRQRITTDNIILGIT